MATPGSLQEPPDFSLVMGGPIFQLFRRSRLSGDALELLRRRIVVITLIAWLPLLLLSMRSGHLLNGGVRLSFLHDIEAQVRLLIALPVLIAAELIVHMRMRPVLTTFLSRRIVQPQDVPRFFAAVDSAMRIRNSIPLELGLIIFVLTVGQWIWRSQVALGTSTWYAIPEAGRLHLTGAGYWYAFVSIPIWQLILLRWYVRFFIWFRFLWQVSRLNLHLVPTHPDRAAGLSFLGKLSYAFSPILVAQGALLAGLIASRVLYGGEDLLSFKMQAVGFIVFFLVFVFAPLTVFSPQMSRAKRKGLSEYGLLANCYVDEFEQKWILGNAGRRDELLGTGDIQSLADLGNSYAAVKEMRAVPFGLDDMTRLAAVTAAPLVPLGLIMFSFEELVLRIVKVLF